MNSTELLDMIGTADPAFVSAADKPYPKKKRIYLRYLIPAASLVLVLLAALPLLRNHFTGIRTLENKVIIKHVPSPQAEADEIYQIPHWEDMIDCHRYAELAFAGETYVTRLIMVHEENIGAPLGSAAVSGYDHYADTVHTLPVEVFAVKDVNPAAAVCVRFPGEDSTANGRSTGTYVYANADYTPATLGDFMADLNFNSTLETGLVYDERDFRQPVVYEDVPASLIWEKLLSDPTLENHPEKDDSPAVMTIAVSVNILGGHYVAMTLTGDGWLRTNILDTNKAFFLGKEVVDDFVRTVTGNYQGYLYVYDDTPDGLTGMEE
ncbi:MAG: hypothetical protein MJ175_05045 [Clostridia bacterium]|nr:hypothetical protein [Clostridia bacterium]